jgi:hypothetical protein
LNDQHQTNYSQKPTNLPQRDPGFPSFIDIPTTASASNAASFVASFKAAAILYQTKEIIITRRFNTSRFTIQPAS